MDPVKTKVSPPKHRKPEIVAKIMHPAHGHHITTPDTARMPSQPGGGVERRSIPSRGGKSTKRYG